MDDDYYKQALDIVGDPYILINMVWGRVRMLRSGNRPLVESHEKLPVEDIALREIIEGRISCVLGDLVVKDDIIGFKPAIPHTP